MKAALSDRVSRAATENARRFLVAALSACAVLAAILFPQGVQAQSIAIGNASGLPGSTASLTISLDPAQTSISGLQLELVYSSALSYVPNGIQTGSAALAAGKVAQANELSAGRLRVLVSGGLTTIGGGPIAIVPMAIAAGTAAGAITVAFDPGNTFASDPSANPVPIPSQNLRSGTVTVLAPADNTPPVISNVGSSGITQTGATITWTTNEASNTQVEYGATTSYGSTTALNPSPVTSHSQTLSGLTPGTLYHYRVRSRDAAGNLATSGDFTFTTAGQSADSTPPVISAVSAFNVTDTEATIAWSTNEPSDSQIEYGTATGYGSATSLNTTLATAHAHRLVDLVPNTLYHYRVRSADAAGNPAVSGDFSFSTTRPAPVAAMLTLYWPRPAAVAASGEPSAPQSTEYTGLAVTNLDNGPATLTFTAYDSRGARIEGAGITNPAYRILKAREQLSVLDVQLLCDGTCDIGQSAFIKIESSVSRIAGFYMVFDEHLQILDGAALATSPLTEFILPEVDASGQTRIMLANSGLDPAAATFELVGSGGEVKGSVAREISGNGALSADVSSDLFPGLPLSESDYLRVKAGKGVLPFELMRKNTAYAAILSGQAVSSGATILYSPQYAVGGPWRSTMSVVNIDAVPDTLSLRLYAADGRLLGAGELQIPPRGKVFIAEQDFFVTPGSEITEGYVQVMSRSARLAGSVVFGDPDRARFVAALPLTSRLEQSLLFSHVASDATYFMGIAIVNPGSTDATANIELYDRNGLVECSTTQPIPARGRKSLLLTEYFPSLIGVDRTSGYVKVTATQGVAALALFGTNSQSVLSAIPAQSVP